MNTVKRNSLHFPFVMNEILKPDWFGGMENTMGVVPAVNIKEGEKEFELELMVPGREKSDFSIVVDVDVLTVSAEAKQNDEKDSAKYTRREFKFSAFKRAFALPETIDNDKIVAKYENGLLRFVFPKKEEALPKAKRMIELS
ncbi:MAG: Hsp20/alpha crystallin family protein [Pricia sp.]